MSYCVNCGVELDKTSTFCPLCRTKVYHPEQPAATDLPTPYPSVKGVSEPVRRKEFTILMSVIFATIAVVCVILNLFVLPYGRWSLYVADACAAFWVFLLPVFFPQKINVFFSLACNGIVIAFYCAGISCLHPGNGWFLSIALPLIILLTIILEILCYFTVRRKSNMITKAILITTAVSVFCGAVEILVDFYLRGFLSLGWSAIVLTCGAVIDLILFVLSRLTTLRAEVRRRIDF